MILLSIFENRVLNHLLSLMQLPGQRVGQNAMECGRDKVLNGLQSEKTHAIQIHFSPNKAEVTFTSLACISQNLKTLPLSLLLGKEVRLPYILVPKKWKK